VQACSEAHLVVTSCLLVLKMTFDLSQTLTANVDVKVISFGG
jgi:hypothetical protein